jgi:anti-anti-sigma factor
VEITHSLVDGIVEMRVQGRLDSYWAAHLDKTLAMTVREGHFDLRLDLSDINFISSAGIGILMKYYKQLTAIEGSLVVTNPSKRVRTTLDITGLTPFLIQSELAAAQAPAGAVDRRFVDRGVAFEVFELAAGAGLRCRTVGSDEPLDTARFREQDCVSLRCPEASFALGLGAFGESFSDCRSRFGEFLAVAGAAAYLPTDGSNVADFLVARGAEAPEVKVLYALACEGSFTRLARFDVAEGEAISLANLTASCLEISGAEVAGLVIVAESAGLVGAALRCSPVIDGPDGRASLFAHPDIRSWLTFTAEPAFPCALTLVVGVVARSRAGGAPARLRALGPDASPAGHLHAAAFSFRPLKKGRLDLKETVATLFHAESLLSILHLLHDDREIASAGQSHFVRGACWIGPIADWH